MTAKEFCTLAAEFALLGYELRSLLRSHATTLFEVRRGREAVLLSHGPDVAALLRQVQAAAP